MRVLIAPLVAIALALAVPAAAQEVDPARVAAFVALIEANGCEMTEEEADGIFPPNGFTDQTETRAIVTQLFSQGRAVATGSTLRVITEACSAADAEAAAAASAADPARVAAFVTLMQEAGCSILVAELQEVLAAGGFPDEDEARRIVAQVRSEGLVLFVEDPQRFVLVNEACPAE